MRQTALVRMMRAELRGRRLRAMALFVVVIALASAALVAGLSGQSKASDQFDATFDEANGAHVTVDGNAQQIAAVVDRPGVAASTHTYRRSAKDLDVLRHGDSLTTTLGREMAADDRSVIARPLVRDGRWVRAGAPDEIVVDRAFGMEQGIDVGDRIAIGTPAGPRSFLVVGRAIDLVDCLYPNCDPVTTWVDPAGFARLGVDSTELAFLRLRHPDAVDRFIASAAETGAGMQGWIDTRDDTLGVYQVFGAFLGGFGVFVMIAAAIVVAGSMATRAVARRRDIGLLKAVGTTPRQVAASIVLAHVAVAAVGVGIGWVLGSLLAPLVEIGLGDVLGTGGVSFSTGGLVVAFAVVEAIVALATVIPAWRAGRVPTTAALASVTGHRTRGRRIGTASARLGVGPVGVAGIRDALGRPARSILTALALALAIVAVLTTLSTQRTIDRMFGDPALSGDPEEVRIYPSRDGASDAIPEVLASESAVASWFTETPQGLALGDETFLGIAMGGNVARAGYDVAEGRMFRRPGEAVAGWGWLDRFGLSVGDHVRVRADGRPLDFTIVGRYREGEDTGEVLRFSLADLQSVLPDRGPEWASVNLRPGVDAGPVVASFERRLRGVARVERQTVESSDELDAFRLAFLLVSALVIIVALANLASTMVLAVRERTHDFGVLRAVGVTPRQVAAMVAIGGGALAVIATVIAVPIGWWVSGAVADVAGIASGIGPGIGAGPGVLGVLVVVPVAIAVAASLGAVASRRAAHAQISELVRYE